jgi:urease accessory protein
VYRSARGCESETAARVGGEGVLVLAPDPTACFAGARFRQRIDLDLVDGASVALCDVLSAGRSARGERWALGHCLLALAVRRDGRTVLDESWLLDRAHGALPARLGRFEALATVLLLGPAFAEMADRWRAELDAQPPAAASAVLESGSAVEGGAVLRLAGTSVEELSRRLRARLAALPALLGDDPWARRA